MTHDKARKYLEITLATSKLSKDKSTQVGAIILGPAHEVRSLGYNGAPRGCAADDESADESHVGSRALRPEKYFWFSHAELNAITNAARAGTPLDGGTLLVTHPPCMDCARAIVQSGIKEVFCLYPSPEFVKRWDDSISRSRQLFDECGVTYTWI